MALHEGTKTGRGSVACRESPEGAHGAPFAVEWELPLLARVNRESLHETTLAARASSSFSLSFARLDGQVRVSVSGDLDGRSAEQLRDALFDLIEGQGNLSIVLDLAGVTFIDSRGLEALTLALSWTRSRGGTITLARAPVDAVTLFQTAGFE
jgi:anti-sigma B factor antagonist